MDTDRNLPFYEPKNFYDEDPFFQKLMRHYLSEKEFQWAEKYLRDLGELSAKGINPLVLESDQNPPVLVSYDPIGNRIDQIKYHASYQNIAKMIYEFGIIGLGHSPEFKSKGRKYGPLLKFGLGYLFSQTVSVLYCPICMTDGTLQILKNHASEEIKSTWIPRITSMNMETFCDGGMYLTEVQGGSDVGANTCRAYQVNGEWKIEGEKWFCSNAGSKTSLVLARPDGAPEGTKGLGLFLVPLTLENGEKNGIRINRIKSKLGTREMATAEIEFVGATGYLVGELNKGFAYMTEMLNLSRTYNSIWAVGLMQRAYLEASFYAKNRVAFGKPIEQHPLVADTLKKMKEDTELQMSLSFELIKYMDRVEGGSENPDDKVMLRLLIPIVKFYTAEKCIESSHRAIEIFAGNGCIEEFPVAKILRDSQILAVWEGTANILALDLLRVLKKIRGHETFLSVTKSQISSDIPSDSRPPLLERWDRLNKQFSDVLEGKDGFGGQFECRSLAENAAQLVQEIARQSIQKG